MRTPPPLLALVLLPALAAAMPPPQGAEPPVAPLPSVDPRPIAAAREAAPADLVVTSEPLGQGNDASSRRLEVLLKERADALLACRPAHAGEEVPRFVQLEVKLRGNGTVRWTKVRSSTGDASIDGCVQAITRATVLDPPPMFDDRLQLNVTWAKRG